MQYREGLEYLVAWYPTGLLALFAYRGHNLGPNRAILPREIRERIKVLPVGYEFHLSDSRTLLRTGMYACKVYDNTILTVEKVPLQATLADEPIIRAAFDIYLEDGLLVYVAEPCVAGEGIVFVHLYPVEVEDLPPHRVEYGFDNLDFQWNRLAGGGRRCVRVVRLPEYEIARLATGEYNERGPLWQETVVFPKRPAGGGGSAVARVRTALEGTSPSREPL